MILDQPSDVLPSYFNWFRIELFEADFISLLKALILSGHWDRDVSLFKWLIVVAARHGFELDSQVIELMTRILGRESQHTIVVVLGTA